ncbi:MAG: TldD/PmbA family protein [Bacteroidetes bacterium]|nr:TldD/PmbA family protein [Bacteroidota bacterium]
MSNNYQALTERLIKKAKLNGAELKISIRSDKNFEVGIRNNEVEELQEASSTNLSLSVNLDNKVASAATSDLSLETLNALLDGAIERAKASSTDESAIFPKYEELKIAPETLKMYSEDIKAITPEEKIAAARKIEEICLKDNRITLSGGSSYSTNESEYILALSNGFYGSYKSSGCSVGVYLQTGKDENAFQDGWSDSARSPKLLLPIEIIAKLAIERATRMIGAKKIPTQTIPIIIDTNVAGSVIGFMLECINGRNIYMNQSVFTGQIDKQIANSSVNIYDDPLIAGSPAARPFDAEGIPCRKNIIIENGVLKNYILNTYSAKKLNMEVNGLASGTSNLFLQKGSFSENDIIKSIDKGLLLLKTLGQGTDATNGGFSKGGYGLMIEKGELTHPVSEITISSNIKNMLLGIGKIANNPNERRAWKVPSFLIDEMTVSGE